jgi:hypothetical protein
MTATCRAGLSISQCKTTHLLGPGYMAHERVRGSNDIHCQQLHDSVGASGVGRQICVLWDLHATHKLNSDNLSCNSGNIILCCKWRRSPAPLTQPTIFVLMLLHWILLGLPSNSDASLSLNPTDYKYLFSAAHARSGNEIWRALTSWTG